MNTTTHKMSEKLLSLFTLSKLEVLNYWELPNGYYTKTEDPWLLVQTVYGMIKIGWRKRVINIDWEHTECDLPITEDEVTKDRYMVHAWSYEKALHYLNTLADNLKKQKCTGLSNEEKAKMFYSLGLQPSISNCIDDTKTQGYGELDNIGCFQFPLEA